MKSIKVIKGQNIFDIAVQEYGNIEAAFEIIENNPDLKGENDFPAGFPSNSSIDFYPSLSINENVGLIINENSSLVNKKVQSEINTVLSE